MFKEYEVVIAKNELTGVPKGAKGTVLIIFDDTHYEVEFIDDNGDTIAVKTVSANDIEKIG